MKQSPEEKNKTLRGVLKQHWLHCRHIETERAWFMNVYAIVTGGILAYAFTNGALELWPIYFLIAFTAIGLLLNIRWRQAFKHHQNQIKAVGKELEVEIDLEVRANWFWNIFRTRFLFSYFYAITLIGLIVLVITEVI